MSNEWSRTRADLDTQVRDHTALKSAYDSAKAELEKTGRQLTETRDLLSKTEDEVQAAQQAIKEREAELEKRAARIANLEAQNDILDKQATEMKSAIGSLETRIADTQQRLSSAEGDRDFLFGELRRLQAEKADLERRLNDVVALREQIQKLKDELSLARRIEAIRKSLYGADNKKGAELLQRGMRNPEATNAVDLNVEIRRDGSATIVAPTNTPPAN
jgi:chromosome segregation ATPase